jgi:hypothetical protein
MNLLTSSEIKGLEKSILNIFNDKLFVSGEDIYKTIAFRLKKGKMEVGDDVLNELNKMVESGKVVRYQLKSPSKYDYLNPITKIFPEYLYMKNPKFNNQASSHCDQTE